MDIIKLVIDIVKDVGPTVWKYVNYQVCHSHYVSEFEEMQTNLKRRRKDIAEELQTQLNQPGKITKGEVEAWLKEAEKETVEVVDDLIHKGGCFTYICSSRKLDKRTQALNQDGGIFKRGEKYTKKAGMSLAVDDHSIEYCALVFKEKQEWLKHQKEIIEANLKTQCMQPGKIARREVEEWLEKASQQIVIKVEDLINQGESSSSSILKKKTEELKQTFEQGEKYTNTGVSLVVDDYSIKGLPLLVETCSGRDDIQDKILEWLKGDKVTRIAVWGMGGVGKTAIMKQVHNQLLKEPKFNKVIWVKVSKDFDIIVQQKKKFDILKFQKRIASSLELKLDPEDHENETKLTGLISQKLVQGSYVLILDDVWQQFHPEDVGIPDLVGNNGCKLVLTTRLQDVARAMDCEVIHVNPLPYDDALVLFLEKFGSEVLSDGKNIRRDIEPFLKQILHKCDGVPLAIVTVAKSMRGKLHPRSWKLALSELSKFEGIVDHLKFSYECLEVQCQKCFLYCALYPKDYEIPKEELIEYWIEETLIHKEGKTREAMYYKGYDILDMLVDNCLLELVEKENKEDCVSMHDLLREMALKISPQFLVKAGMALEKLPEEHEWREDLLKVSLMKNCIIFIPSSMPSPKCPMLTTLLLSDNDILTIPEAFFEHMLGLKILDLSNNFGLGRLPSSVSKLEKLTTLLLRGCESLREVPSLSNFRDLKKLDLWGTSIEEVPQGLNMLTNMKYLCLGRELSIDGFGGRLFKIPDGLLQTLSKLQHLEVDYSTPLKGEEIRRLGKLEYLKGQFSGVHDMSIFVNSGGNFLNMYSLFIGSYSHNFSDDCRKLKTIMCCDIDICEEPNWLPSDVQRLEIKSCKDVRSLDDIRGFRDVTDLQFVHIRGCDGMESVLSLSWLSRCNPDTFSPLKHISVLFCNKINKLFPVRWLRYLQNLETIQVESCGKMEEIIWSEYEGGEKVTLPRLERLELMHLPQLKSIYSGSSTVLICNSIKKIKILMCPKIESVFWSGFNPLPTLEDLDLQNLNMKSVFDGEALSLSPTLPPTTPFSLQTIKVYSCHQLKKVFSSGWLLSYFQFLEIIHVSSCKQMEELILSSAYEEEKVTLPNLRSLELAYLPQLKSIYSGFSSVLICNSIKKISIQNCPNIESVFWSGFNPLPTLEDLDLQNLNMKSVFDGEALGLSPTLPPTTPFSLQTIKVYSCHQLKKVFSSGWLLSYFQFLEIIHVSSCKQMEELILSSTYEEEQVTLPNLQGLSLEDLPQLKGIYSGSSSVLICNSIKKIYIQNCPKIENVFWSGFNPLPTLEDLHLQNLNLKLVFDEEALGLSPDLPLTTPFFLKKLLLFNCNQLRKVFSSGWLLGYFQFLERIRVSNCEQMEELISSSVYEEEKVTLPNLQSLSLEDLPQLNSIYSGSSSVLICNSIKKIYIQNCPKIESVFSSGFNPLPTLEDLDLQNLNMKSVFDEEALGLSPNLPPTTPFSLKKILLFNCNQLRKVFSSGWLLGYFQFLERIHISNCEQMEELTSSLVYEEEKVILPNLQRLELEYLSALKSISSSSNTV